MKEPGPLSGVRVVEIAGGLPAAFCTRVLRGFGAETIRVTVGDAGSEQRTDTLTLHEQTFFLTGTSHLTVDQAGLAGRVAGADIVIEDQAPGWMSANGIDPRQLRADRPALIITSISPFGQTGPRAHWSTTNAVQFAVGGLMSLTGEPHRPPLVTGGDQAYLLGGLHALAATTVAHLGVLRHGLGTWIDLSMQECAASMPELYGAMSEYETHAPVIRSGNSVRASWGVYRCSDGFAGVCCLERQIPALFQLLGEPVACDERFADPVSRADHNDELLAHVMAFMSDHTKEELTELSPRHRVPFGAVRTPRELLADEAYDQRGFFDHVETERGPVTMPGRPFPGLSWSRPEPKEPGDAPEWDPRPLPDRSDLPSAPRPLRGLRVLDLSMMWAGPYATKLLAECGADVIKIESPSAWDNIRTLVPQDSAVADPWNSAYYFNEYNHSKRSLTLDLAQDAGRDLFLRLVAEADVVIENYRADVLDKLGLGYDILRAANERIVLVSMAGFGKTGPLRDHVGFGPIIEMMSGLMSLTGYGDDDVPYKTGVSYGDPVGGLHAVAATALSLTLSLATGKGRHIDMAQRETASSMAGPAFVAASVTDDDPLPTGNRHPTMAPQGCYPTAGDDQWIVMSIRDDREWGRLCRLMNRDDLSSLTTAQRRHRHDELDAAIEAWTRHHEARELTVVLQDSGIPAGQVLDTLGIKDDPQLVNRGFFVQVPNPKMRPYRQTGPTWRLIGNQPHRMVRSPWFGEHNRVILTGDLGLGETELLELIDARVVADAPINPGVG